MITKLFTIFGSSFLLHKLHSVRVVSLQIIKDSSTQGPGEGEQIRVLNYLWNECLCQDTGEVVFP